MPANTYIVTLRMAWSRFCTEKPGYSHHISSANHAACPYCGEANPMKQDPTISRETPQPEVIDLSSSPPALQSTRIAPSRFAELDQQSHEAQMKSIAWTRKILRIPPNAGSLVHSARQTSNPSKLSSPMPQIHGPHPPQLRLELRITVNEISDLRLNTYDNTSWKVICQFTLHMKL